MLPTLAEVLFGCVLSSSNWSVVEWSLGWVFPSSSCLTESQSWPRFRPLGLGAAIRNWAFIIGGFQTGVEGRGGMPEEPKSLSDSFLPIHKKFGNRKVPGNFWTLSPSFRWFPEFLRPTQIIVLNIYKWNSSRGPHPQNSIYYLITKTAVAVKKKKEKKRKKSVQFPGHPRIPKADPTGKTFTNSHSRRGSTPKIKIQSGFLKLVLLWSISEFSFICFRSLLGLVLPPPALHGWRQFDLQFDWELHFCLEGETSKSVSQIIPRRLQY